MRTIGRVPEILLLFSAAFFARIMRDAMKNSVFSFRSLEMTKVAKKFNPVKPAISISIILLCVLNSFGQQLERVNYTVKTDKEIKTGAAQTEKYLSLLQNKNVAIVANQTSIIGKKHLVDTLLSLGVKVKKVFGPEHGFRGEAADGEAVNSTTDSKTGLPIISLYGENKKPKPQQLDGVDIVIFDIQDVGARFYTFISTMTYTMEACAEKEIPFIVLDRPNPNGYYVDGPVLEKEFSSFVGLHPVPVVHGLTIGEYAKMVNGEGWLKNGIKCNLTVIPLQGYEHSDYYQLPVKPSPNLPNMTAVYLYPSLCFFEGTVVSVGRGTEKPFLSFGYPKMKEGSYTFTPKSMKGATNPPYKDQLCRGFDVADFGDIYVKNLGRLYLFWLIESYKSADDKKNFFNDYFNKLAGNATLKEQIIAGKTEEEIRKSWQPELKKFKEIRKKYLLYKDFE